MTVLLCRVCDQSLAFRWTDTHGIAVCVTCGLPYRIYHYDGETRVEKPPTCAIHDAWLPLGREYWTETQMPVFPGAYCIVMRDGQSYSGHTREDIDAFDQWLAPRRERWPPQPEDILMRP